MSVAGFLWWWNSKKREERELEEARLREMRAPKPAPVKVTVQHDDDGMISIFPKRSDAK
jgi:hypothetical protein